MAPLAPKAAQRTVPSDPRPRASQPAERPRTERGRESDIWELLPRRADDLDLEPGARGASGTIQIRSNPSAGVDERLSGPVVEALAPSPQQAIATPAASPVASLAAAASATGADAVGIPREPGDAFLRGLDFLRRQPHAPSAPQPPPPRAEVTVDEVDQQVASEAAVALQWVARGNAQFRHGVLSGARRCYDTALRADPSCAIAYNNRGNIRAQLGDAEGAIADYDRALQRNPAYVGAYSNRGNARRARGDIAGAIDDYDAAIALDPTFAVAFNNRGNARADLDDMSGALEDFAEALRIDPSYEVALNNRGVARKALGDLDAAFNDYDTAIAINPFYARAYCNRADLHLRRGCGALALQDYERYLGLGGGILAGDHEEVEALIAHVQQLTRSAPYAGKTDTPDDPSPKT